MKRGKVHRTFPRAVLEALNPVLAALPWNFAQGELWLSAKDKTVNSAVVLPFVVPVVIPTVVFEGGDFAVTVKVADLLPLGTTTFEGTDA